MNDLNGEVTNFFRGVKHRAADLAELLKHELIHPAYFRDLQNVISADELVRALRFAFTTWYSYGAKGEHFAGGNLKEMLRGGSRRPLDTVRELLMVTAKRFRG